MAPSSFSTGLWIVASCLMHHELEACTVCSATCCSMCSPNSGTCPHSCEYKASTVPESCAAGANSPAPVVPDCTSLTAAVCITTSGCTLWQGNCYSETGAGSPSVTCTSLTTGDCIIGAAQSQCWVDYYTQTCQASSTLDCCSLGDATCIQYSQCKHVPKLGCRPATSSPVNVSLTWALSETLAADLLLNATEEAFDRAGLLPPGTCGTGQLKPIEVEVCTTCSATCCSMCSPASGTCPHQCEYKADTVPPSCTSSSASSRRLSVASSVNVNLVYRSDQAAMFTKVKEGGSTLQADLQTAFLQALVDGGDSTTTATLALGKITVDESGANSTSGTNDNATTTPDNPGLTSVAKGIGGVPVAFAALVVAVVMAMIHS